MYFAILLLRFVLEFLLKCNALSRATLNRIENRENSQLPCNSLPSGI
jgi:hypothetical protein